MWKGDRAPRPAFHSLDRLVAQQTDFHQVRLDSWRKRRFAVNGTCDDDSDLVVILVETEQMLSHINTSSQRPVVQRFVAPSPKLRKKVTSARYLCKNHVVGMTLLCGRSLQLFRSVSVFLKKNLNLLFPCPPDLQVLRVFAVNCLHLAFCRFRCEKRASKERGKSVHALLRESS